MEQTNSIIFGGPVNELPVLVGLGTADEHYAFSVKYATVKIDEGVETTFEIAIRVKAYGTIGAQAALLLTMAHDARVTGEVTVDEDGFCIVANLIEYFID